MNMRALGVHFAHPRARQRVRSDWPDPGWLAVSLGIFVLATSALVLVLSIVGD
ncbi:MAG: hypothetical protein ACRDPG_06625 [Nocardioidaceae bacterium]